MRSFYELKRLYNINALLNFVGLVVLVGNYIIWCMVLELVRQKEYRNPLNLLTFEEALERKSLHAHALI